MPVLVWDFGGTHMTNTMKSLIDLILMLVGLGTLTYVSLIHHSDAIVAIVALQKEK